MDRKWLALIALFAAVAVIGCKSAPPPPPPPAPVVQEPVTDVKPKAEPAGPVDEVEPPQPPSLEEIQAQAERNGLLGDVFFDFDKFDLRDDAKQRLAKNAEFMKANAGYTFRVAGHCDERGTNEYNIALGQSRSSAAVDYLVSLGVSASRFQTISYGEERPYCTESNEGCWQRNRRAQFTLTGQ